MNDNLTKGDIGSEIRKIAIPASIGFFFSTLFNIVDTYFAGRLGDAALAGITTSFPAFFIIIAASAGLGTAGTALIANHLGKGDVDGAKKFHKQTIVLALIAGVLFTILGLIFGKVVLQSMNLDADVIRYALDYLDIIFSGITFFILVNVLNSYLNAQGNTKIYRNLLIASFFVNIFLNYWFMYGGFGIQAMGIKGLALSTVLIQLLECIYLVYYLKKQDILDYSIKTFIPNKEIIKQIFFQALPSSFNMMSMAIGSFIISFFIAIFGRDAIAGYGVAIRIEQIALIPTIGLNIAALSIIGQNNGAGRFDRIRDTIKKSIFYGLYALVFSVFIIFVFGERLFELFTENKEITSYGMQYLYIALLIFMSYVISFVGTSALQGIKYPNRALITGLLRQIILPLIVFPIVIYYFKFGILGLWWSLCIINWVVSLITLIIAERGIRQREKEHPLKPNYLK